ncbi:MAG: extracellular solute-binding protein [Treponema sp.]|nr:extracellular solute-binding protein [Treponema sp.]
MIKFGFRKLGDNVLFAIGLAVLITAIIYSWHRRDREPAAANIVFAQWWQEDLQANTLQNIIAEFELIHQGIRVILAEQSYEDLRFDLFNPARSGEGQDPRPDVIALDALWVPKLLEMNVIESPQAPILSFIYVLYYNVEILAAAGLTRPPRTRTEFLAAARAVHADGQAAALGFAAGTPRGVFDSAYPWIWAAGAQLMRDRNPVAAAAPITQSLAFLASLNNEGLIAPNVFSADRKEMLDDFISGRTAFMIAPTKYIALAREHMGDENFSITAVPVLDNQAGQPFFASVEWTAGVYSGSAHPEAAQAFAAFLARSARAISYHAGGSVPASPVPDPLYSKVWEIALAGETAEDFSGIAGEYDLEEIFREELISLFAGQSSPAAAAAAIQQRWLAVLAE